MQRGWPRHLRSKVHRNHGDTHDRGHPEREDIHASLAADTERKLQGLCEEAETCISNLKQELDTEIEQETLCLCHDARITISNISDQHDLTSVTRTKDRPSPLSSKPRKAHRKRKAGTYAGPLQPGTLQPSDESEAMATDDQLTDLEPVSPL